MLGHLFKASTFLNSLEHVRIVRQFLQLRVTPQLVSLGSKNFQREAWSPIFYLLFLRDLFNSCNNSSSIKNPLYSKTIAKTKKKFCNSYLILNSPTEPRPRVKISDLILQSCNLNFQAVSG